MPWIKYVSLTNIENLVKKVADQMQQYTQFGGVRPYGVSLIFAGTDTIGPRLFDCDPAGTINEYKSVAIGAGKDAVTEYVEREYKDGMSLEDAVKLGIAALKSAVTDEGSMKEPELASIVVGDRFHIYTNEEIQKYLN